MSVTYKRPAMRVQEEEETPPATAWDPSQDPSRVPWAQVRAHLTTHWKPGEHFSIVAPTDYGKTRLAVRGLLPIWRYTMILDVKGDDPELVDSGHHAVRGYPRGFLLTHERYRIHPPPGQQRPVFDEAFRKIYASGKGRKRGQGTWVVLVDEVRVMADKLGLADDLETTWIYARGRGVTLVAGTQAPRYVPAEFYDQPKWFAIGATRDRRTLRRLSEIGGDVDMILRVVPTLEWHEFLFLGPRRWAAISRQEG